MKCSFDKTKPSSGVRKRMDTPLLCYTVLWLFFILLEWMDLCLLQSLFSQEVSILIKIFSLCVGFAVATFSSLLPTMVCMLVGFFSIENNNVYEINLNTSFVRYTVIWTIGYGLCGAIRAANNHIGVEIMFIIISMVYAWLFYKRFINRE